MNLDPSSSGKVVAVLAFAAVAFFGASIIFLFGHRRKAMRRRLEMMGTTGDRAGLPGKPRFLHLMEKIGNFVSHGHTSTTLWEQLVRAGFMSRRAPAIYTGVKIILLIAGLTVTAILMMPSKYSAAHKTWFVVMGGGVLFFVPNLFVLVQEKKRRDEIRQYLPDAVDLLEICVSSGIGLDMAWNIVCEEIHHVSPILGTAMDLSNFEMHLGASRTEAMRNMAARTGAEQLSSMAAILVQSERFGTSVAVALREFATSMREDRRMSAEENAEKIAVKLIVPMVLFVFPAVIVVVVGPAAINIARSLLNR